jgi:hypothetical protein
MALSGNEKWIHMQYMSFNMLLKTALQIFKEDLFEYCGPLPNFMKQKFNAVFLRVSTRRQQKNVR